MSHFSAILVRCKHGRAECSECEERARLARAADAFAVLGMIAAVYSKGYDDCRDDIIGHAEQLPNTKPRALRWVP